MDKINKNKKVLIMTVGTGATGADIAHGLFFSINDSNPDLLVLIGSQKSFDSTLSHLKELIKKESIDCEIVEKNIEEINDFERLHFEYSNIIEELLHKGFIPNKIAVDYTSGTKSMSAALVSAALAKKIGSINYVFGERGEGGRVKSGTERRSSLSPNKIFSLDILNKAIDYFNSYRFSTCLELLNSFEFHPDFNEKANILFKLTSLFDHWDKFNFNAAFEESKKINHEELKLFCIKDKFEKYYQPLLYKLKSENESYERILDLLGNANRRASEGKYDDAIARLYRTLEMVGQIEFFKEFKCSTSDVKIENIPETFRADINQNYLNKKDGKIKIPLFGTYDLLNKIGNKVGILFNEKRNDIEKVLSLRNKSILAHGNVPLNKQHFQEARSILQNFIKIMYNDLQPIEFPNLKL